MDELAPDPAGETPAIVGTWKLMVESQLGNNARDLVVNADLSDTYGGDGFSEFAISNVKIDGDTVQFDDTLSVQGQELPSHVTLAMDGTKVAGKSGAAAVAAGKMSTEGDMTAIAKIPALAAAFAKLHDTLARRTL